jgi:hypothetical protein
MRAGSPAKIALYVTLTAVICASGAFARFLVDDFQADIKQEQPKPAGQSTPPPQNSSSQNVVPADYPRNISVTLLQGEKNSVQITWDATAEAKDSFVILRSNQLQNTAETALSSLPVKVIPVDRLRVVLDRNLPPGRYFYCVVPKSKYDDKNVHLYPGENYSTNPIVIFGEGDLGESRTVASIRAVTIEDRNVLLTWEPINNFTGEYIIFRSKSPIDTPEKLNNADPVGRISSQKSRFLDSDATPGRHFYAIACKTIDGVMYSDMKQGFNYTSDAVFIGGTIGVRGIRGKVDNGNVLITWKMTADSFNKMFYLLRTEIRPTARESLAGAYIVDTIQSSAEKFTDKSVPSGRYYYILAPMNYRDNDDFVLIGGVNVTDPPIQISSEGEAAAQEKKAESKESSDKKGKQAGLSQGDSTAAKKPLAGPSEEEILAYLDELKDLSAQRPSSVIEEKPRIPEKIRPSVDPRFPWEDEKYEDAQEETSAIPQKKEIKPEQKTAEKTPEKKTETKKAIVPEKIKPEQKKAVPQKTAEKRFTSIDAVIAGPFSRGDYSSSITLLKTALTRSVTQEDAAKAKLFIARSYIELGKFREAIGYLSGSDVKKYYPKESGFWKDYSIDRLR